MAQANQNTGITQNAGSGPQGNAGTGDNNNPNQSNDGSGSGDGKLIAGKWKTVEEAVEKGYGGLEQGFHQLSEQVGGLVRILEAAMDPSSQQGGGGGYTPVGQGGGGGQGWQPGGGQDYGRGQQQNDPDYVNPADFVVNPGQHLRQRDERLLNRVQNIVATTVTNVVANASVVNDFKARNPDLLPHELTVQGFMRNLDPRIPLAKRLDMAAKQTRDYIGSIKGSGGGPNPNPAPNASQYVEGPRGPAQLGGQGNQQQQNSNEGIPLSEQDSEEGLAAYINERNNSLAQNFGYGFKK